MAFCVKDAGTGHGKAAHPSFILETPIFLDHGYNEIALLSMTVGLQVCMFWERFCGLKIPGKGSLVT